MKILLRYLVLAALLMIPGFARTDIATIIPEFKSYIQKSMKDWSLPGTTVGIIQDGKIVFLQSFGVASVVNNQPVNNDTIYPLSSSSKTFLTFLVGQLLDEKKLSLEDSLTKLVTELKSPSLQSLNLMHIFSHSTGFDSFSLDTLASQRFSQKYILDKFNLLVPEAHPGQIHHYQNLMLGVVGLAIERIAHKNLEDVAREKIFLPLNMNRTYMKKPYDKQQNEGWLEKIKSYFKKNLEVDSNSVSSHDHDYRNKKTVAIPHNTMMYAFPGTSGIHSCGNDMAKWIQFLLEGNEKVISKNTHQLIFQPRTDANSSIGRGQFTDKRFQDLKCSLGFFVGRYAEGNNSEKVILLPAGVVGNRSIIWLIPEQRTGIFVLSNLGGRRVSFFPESVVFWFMDRFLGVPEKKDWSTELHDDMYKIIAKKASKLEEEKHRNPKPAGDLNSYQGIYEHVLYGRLEVSLKGDILTMKLQDKIINLAHHNGNKFTFNQRELSPNWGHNDFGVIEFVNPEGAKKFSACFINILFEGEDNLFHRTKKSS